jgi:ubiquinone biosynthesis protein Coq4
VSAAADSHRNLAKIYKGKADQFRKQAAEQDEIVKHHLAMADKIDGVENLGHLTSISTNPNGTIYYTKNHEAAVRRSQGSSGDSWEVYLDHHYTETHTDRLLAEVVALGFIEKAEA